MSLDQYDLSIKLQKTEINNRCLYMLSLLACSDVDVDYELKKQGINSVAIYGLADCGRALWRFLSVKRVKVCYGMDKNPNKDCGDLMVADINGELQDVDAVIVSVPFYMDEIREMLHDRIDVRIVSMTDVLRELLLCDKASINDVDRQ